MDEQEEQGCSLTNPLLPSSKNLLSGLDSDAQSINEFSIAKKTNITVNLSSVKVSQKGYKLLIERQLLEGKSCPPFCIQPLTIQDVTTVGELETLAFMERLETESNNLLLDVREHQFFKESTLPGAINLPLSMVQKKSPYFEEIIHLLGAKNTTEKRYFFKDPSTLLIFSEGVSDNIASTFIHILIDLGYPQDKLLYYRGGVESWKHLGLTLF